MITTDQPTSDIPATTGIRDTTAPSLTTTTLALAASLALTVTTVLGYAVLSGAPNLGMAAVAVLPLGAAVAFATRRRWAPYLGAAAAATAVAVRIEDLAFDLVRPAALLLFVVALVHVAAGAVALSASVINIVGRRVTPGRATVATIVASALLGAGLLGGLAMSGRPDDASSLTVEQVAGAQYVDMINYRYEPAQLRVAEGGGTVFRFANDSDDGHTITVPDLGLTVYVPSGREHVLLIDAAPGSYAFHCEVGSHREDGMVGQLDVIDPHAGHHG